MNSILVILLLSFYSCGSNSSKKAFIKDIPQQEETNMINKNTLTKEQIEPKVSWRLIKMNEENAHAIFDKVPTLRFDTIESRISGNAGCNQYNSSYQLNGNSFTISPAITTRMMCNNKNEESRFLRALESISFSKMEENTLVFMKEDGQIVLEFVKE